MSTSSLIVRTGLVDERAQQPLEADEFGSRNGARSTAARSGEQRKMDLQNITLALFAACNSARIIAYLPQIYKAATDVNGASAISGMTWSLFLIAHLSTIAHAIVNLGDWWLAACFAGNAACCVAILGVSWWKRRQFFNSQRDAAARSFAPLT